METFAHAFDAFLKQEHARGVIVSDQVSNPGDRKARLMRWQEEASPLFGIAHIVDTIHFVDSHSSPLVQLADAVTYMLAQDFAESTRWTRERERVRKLARTVRRYP